MLTFAIVSAWFASHKRILIYIGIGLLILVVGITTYQCSKKTVNIDIGNIQKINSQNEAEIKEGLRKTIEENDNIIKTVDQRNTLSEEDIETRQKEIDKKVNDGYKKIQEVKLSDKEVTSEDLECILVPDHCN